MYVQYIFFTLIGKELGENGDKRGLVLINRFFLGQSGLAHHGLEISMLPLLQGSYFLVHSLWSNQDIREGILSSVLSESS